jgi:tetrahydromethanopterin S-methyltransferase subunit F
VRVGEASLGTTPIILEGLEAGSLEVVLEAGGRRAQQTVEVPPEGRAVYTVVLDFPEEEPAAPAGGAQVAAGGRAVMPQPLPFDRLPVPGPPGDRLPRRPEAEGEPAEPDGDARRLLGRIETLSAERDRLRGAVARSNRRHRRGARISLGIGSLSAGASGVLYLLSQQSYEDYREADTPNEAVEYREQTTAYSRGAIAGAIAAGVGLITGTVFTMLDGGDAAEELLEVEQDLEMLRARYERLYGEPPPSIY